MIAYLDTNAALWLAQGDMANFSSKALTALEQADLLLSPMVLLECEYLYEIKRFKLAAQDIYLKLEHESGIRVCDLPFLSITNAALKESWTRDPFDRIVVAHAKANGFAALISADSNIAQHYPRTIW